MILGVNKGVLFEERTVTLRSGDLLFVYTDGIVEAQDATGELFGVPRLCGILAGKLDEEPEGIIEFVLQEVSAFSGSATLQDDVSMIVMKVL